MPETCGCKGVRFCAACKDSERVRKLQIAPENSADKFVSYKCYVFSKGRAFRRPKLQYNSTMEEISASYADLNDRNFEEDSFDLPGISLIEDFLSEAEEKDLICRIDNSEWLLSQSGRRKQDYGPKVNFNQRKVRCDRFIGVPDYADLILERLSSINPEKFGNYQPFELCNLEYDSTRQSSIEFHQDDTWIWGERLISLNLIEGSVMTFENQDRNALVFVHMPQRSILLFCDESRYHWKHGIFAWHINKRRIALTMREPGKDFKKNGSLYDKYGKELIERGNIRIKTQKTASFVVSHVGVSVAPTSTCNNGSSPTIRGKTSAYGFFVKMCYEEHRRKFPLEHVLVTEISKKCSEKWKTMSDMEKKRFFELAQKDAERYQNEVQAQGGEQQLRKKKRAKKDPQAPKRALSAFFFFSNERRGEVQTKFPSWKVGQIAQELGRTWKSLSDEERAIYEKKATDDKERYNEEMKSYRETGPSNLSGPSPSNVQQAGSVKMEAQQELNQPQQVQVQYVDQHGNIVHVVNQPAFVANTDNNAVYMNNDQHDPNV